MTTTAELAEFTGTVSYDSLPSDVRDALKKRVLDSVGIGIGAIGAEPVDAVAATVTEFGHGGPSRLWGRKETVPPAQAAMYNTALTRYLDFMDSFLAPGETPHPSDNIASVIACGEVVDASGQDLLEGIGVAYEIQGELAWNAPVRDRGFDHVTHTVVSAAAGAGKVLGLTPDQLRNAIGIAGTAHNALRVTRTGGINEWKGIASANAARNAVYSVLLARNGMEGPVDLFEGQKGWKEVVSGEFEVELDPRCEQVFDTMTKRYVAETYAQSAVEGIIELAEREELDHEAVEAIRLDTFAGAKLIIGGGEGSRYEVETKAQADHSLPYMLAASLIDREMTNTAYESERIRRDAVQTLLRTVEVTEDPELTDRFENGEMPARIEIELTDGTVHRIEKDAFGGHPSDPMSWDQLEEKFVTMTEDRYDADRRTEIVTTIRNLEERDVDDLVTLLD
ncbi:MmgE/PrpD family protein [Halosolutus halophilus]|uniref:MmgE/PrpD family protein n=1 Tax=Halosolutus halophilus TaxID=1552990 RepID=UPI0022352B3D|nr:MmgE/PrpD family protein [Halosolutus halophilus]